MAATLGELARRIDGKLRGRAEQEIDGIAALDSAGARQIAALAAPKYRALLATTRAGAVILSAHDADRFSGSAIIVSDPAAGFARVARFFHPPAAVIPGRHATAVIDPAAKVAASAGIGPHVVVEAGAIIADNAYVGPGCLIGSGAYIGARTRLIARVVVASKCEIGADCILHPGVVIGADGFGYTKDGPRWLKVPQIGRVVVGNDVEIGANTTIDRGALNDTVIGDGVRLDNLIQIAHNVRIGANTAMAACSGVAGSAVIGERCMIGGQAGIAGHIEIADDVVITATSLVTSSIDTSGVYSSSIKAEPIARWRRNSARVHQLDEMAGRLRALEARVRELSGERDA